MACGQKEGLRDMEKDLSGGPVVKTLPSKGSRFDPWSGT